MIFMNPSIFQNESSTVATVPESFSQSKLLPQKVRKLLPPLGSTEGQRDPIAIAKFFCPDGSWSWYATEFDGDDTFFGLVDGDVRELGPFSLSELSSVRGKLGLPVERDLYFHPTALSELP